MTENKGTLDDVPEEARVATLKTSPVAHNPLDDDLEYTGEGGDGQTERVGDGTAS